GDGEGMRRLVASILRVLSVSRSSHRRSARTAFRSWEAVKFGIEVFLFDRRRRYRVMRANSEATPRPASNQPPTPIFRPDATSSVRVSTATGSAAGGGGTKAFPGSQPARGAG